MNWHDIQHFRPGEFACKCGKCGSTGEEMEMGFVTALDLIRGRLGFPLVITSGYRCPAYNDRISTTGMRGPHTTGRAADVGISGEQAHQLITESRLAMSGIGVHQKGPHTGRFIHLDNLGRPRPRPNIWSY